MYIIYIGFIISEQQALDASPKVTRKPTICFRSASAAQNSFDEPHPAEILYENEAEVEFPNGGGEILEHQNLLLARQFSKKTSRYCHSPVVIIVGAVLCIVVHKL